MRTAPLGSISRFIRGVTFKPTDTGSTGVGVMRTKNVQQQLDLSDIVRVPATLVRRDEQYLRQGDTLISSANSWAAVGKACWVPALNEPLAIGGFVTALRADHSAIDARYLYRWFTTPRTQALLRSFSNQTTNIANLNLRRAAELAVPLPTLDEQRRIAAILDHADTLRAKRRRALAHLDALPQAIFHRMFGDPDAATSTVPFGEVATLSGGRNLIAEDSTADSTYRVLKISAVTTGQFKPDESKPLPSDYTPPTAHLVRQGDLLKLSPR